MEPLDDDEVVSREELKAWTHKLTPGWRSETLPAQLSVRRGGEATDFDLALRDGQVVLPTAGEACELEFTLAASSQTGEGLP
jgi:hypothetical protein